MKWQTALHPEEDDKPSVCIGPLFRFGGDGGGIIFAAQKSVQVIMRNSELENGKSLPF